jgi:hypothetical protein
MGKEGSWMCRFGVCDGCDEWGWCANAVSADVGII